LKADSGETNMFTGKSSTCDVYILAIESSCDDTSAAVIRNDTILSNVVAGQKVHEAFGGWFLNWLPGRISKT